MKMRRMGEVGEKIRGTKSERLFLLPFEILYLLSDVGKKRSVPFTLHLVTTWHLWCVCAHLYRARFKIFVHCLCFTCLHVLLSYHQKQKQSVTNSVITVAYIESIGAVQRVPNMVASVLHLCLPGIMWTVLTLSESDVQSGCLRGRGKKYKKGISCMWWGTSTHKDMMH